ncbi:glutathione S-transferase family protein [uncultured Tateyamaria sp.]|uniref:glutathione S-transferase family protein n=1 Tax=uncultured Tateyamaria sp. TaxID=455651 RepID=UPI002602C0A2|nr:glutathione S-transferase family protein [uncultured Tateyamaria sp.]
MPELELFVAPNTCARVATIALEEIGVPFETTLIRTAANQQNSPEFLKINPKGKVPALLIDGAPLTENVAILSWLAATYPEAHLLPETDDQLAALKQTADLAFWAGTVHPVVTRIAMPMKMIPDAAQSFEIVRPKGVEDMNKIMKMIDTRLQDGPWWYGETWSIVDGYLYWVWGRITGVGYDGTAFPNVQKHFELSNARPAVQRAMAREEVNIDVLKSENLYMPPR